MIIFVEKSAYALDYDENANNKIDKMKITMKEQSKTERIYKVELRKHASFRKANYVLTGAFKQNESRVKTELTEKDSKEEKRECFYYVCLN